MDQRQKKKRMNGSALRGFLLILVVVGIMIILRPYAGGGGSKSVMDAEPRENGKGPQAEKPQRPATEADLKTQTRPMQTQILEDAKEKSQDGAEGDAKGKIKGDTEGDAKESMSESEPPAKKPVDPVFLQPVPLLVNKDNPLPSDYEAEIVKFSGGNASVSKTITEALGGMLEAGRENGIQLLAASGYRSRERQQEVLDIDIQALMAQGISYEEAYERKTRTIMPPGYSEHETGLAVDIVALNNQRLDETQEGTPENQWLRENCTEYGFILRYPREKEEITGISYESWHFRYVGVEIASYMKEHDLTLEEFVEEYGKYH